jgi:glutamate 5-kinase
VHFFEKAMAAAGQSGLQALYEMLFSQYHLACSQILASDADFRKPRVRENLKKTVRTLLGVGIIPVINENDVITARKTPLAVGDKIAWDNDSLASLFAHEIGADLLVILTDVDGLYKSTPGGGRELIHEFAVGDAAKVVLAAESRVGPVGQKDKLHACVRVVDSGAVRAAVIAKADPGALLKIVRRERVGTYFAVREGQRLGAGAEEYIDPLYSDILQVHEDEDECKPRSKL